MSLHLLNASESRLAALDYVSEAFAEAVLDGVEVEAVAEAAIATALRELVAAHGEEQVADMVQAWPERLRAGEFSSRLRQ
jgi:nicotinamide mononucleotide (NMN) deamidase PncC